MSVPPVSDYGIYVLDKNGRFVGVHEIYASSDEAALQAAADIRRPHGAEIWQRARRVALLEGPPRHA